MLRFDIRGSIVYNHDCQASPVNKVKKLSNISITTRTGGDVSCAKAMILSINVDM